LYYKQCKSLIRFTLFLFYKERYYDYKKRNTYIGIRYRKAEGCSVVEMECSALAACAKMRNAAFGQILYTADTLADIENYDARNWGENSKGYALRLCLDTVLKL